MPKILKSLTSFIIVMMSVAIANADDTREIGDNFSAKGVDAISINAGVGTVELSASDGDEISVLVSVEPDDGWFGGGPDREDLEKITLQSASKKGKLSLKLDFPRGIDQDDIEEHWEIEVPARLQAKVRISVGRISIDGIAGGVDAHAGVGQITVDVPGGDVRAHASVGDVRVRSATKAAGDIEMDADVGHVSLKLNGKNIEVKRGWGPGASLELEGSGADEFSVTADVGNAELVISGG
ncbi:MAG: hypothetical protein O7F72_03070 [Proteobacteria bacterium]|nr:hypothetical protein [Pseudomonadota bacterium]